MIQTLLLFILNAHGAVSGISISYIPDDRADCWDVGERTAHITTEQTGRDTMPECRDRVDVQQLMELYECVPDSNGDLLCSGRYKP